MEEHIKNFGRKFRVIDKKDGRTSESFLNKDFCLLGQCGCAIAFIEWEKRGEYNFEYVSFKPEDIEFVD